MLPGQSCRPASPGAPPRAVVLLPGPGGLQGGWRRPPLSSTGLERDGAEQGPGCPSACSASSPAVLPAKPSVTQAELASPPSMWLTPCASVGPGSLLCPLCLAGNALASLPVSVPILVQVLALVLGSAVPTGEATHRSQALPGPGEPILTSVSSWGGASPIPEPGWGQGRPRGDETDCG